MEEKIIKSLKKNGAPVKYEQLMSLCGGDGFESAVNSLLTQGLVLLARKGYIGLPEHFGCVTGTYMATSGRAAFLRCTAQSDDLRLRDSEDCRELPMDGDTVIARVRKRKHGAPQVSVCAIIKRAYTVIAGIYNARENGAGSLTPLDAKLKCVFDISSPGSMGAFDGALVKARITLYPRQDENGQATVLEVLGARRESRAEYKAILISNGINEVFSDDVKREAAAIPKFVDEELIASRTDLRSLLTFTIDGDDAKDFDDAVSLDIHADGSYRLYVHIADVSHYVVKDSALDKEAALRGNSVYLPGTVIPMLPEELSNGLCSLNEGQVRLALTCEMEIDANGVRKAEKIYESVIQSNARLTYNGVNAYLAGSEAGLPGVPSLGETLLAMNKLRLLLHERRAERGALEMEIPEIDIKVDADGKPVNIAPAQRGPANMLIEEFMLEANEAVAETLTQSGKPCVYRVHDKPDSDRMSALGTLLSNLGISKKHLSSETPPAQLREILLKADGTKYGNMISYIALRSLKKAIYTTDNRGHYGLASSCYCHFTSPIRRYPDLMIHRLIKLSSPIADKTLLTGMLEEQAIQCSVCEKKAMQAEREADDMLMAQYMTSHIGDEYDAVISGVMDFGIYAQLENLIEGFIHISSLNGWFEFDSEHYCLRNGKKRYALGDTIHIRVINADPDRRRIEFAIV